MGFSKTFIIFAVIFCYSSTYSYLHKNHILYLMNAKSHEQAITSYQKYIKETNEQDFEILQQMALLLLDEGAKSSDPIERQLAMFGAGISASTCSLNILEKGITSPEMETQLTALHFICSLQDNEVNNILIKAMSSQYLETRIEAALQMAIRKHPCAYGQIQSLMQRLPPFIKPFFPQFFGLIGTSDATRILKNMLFDQDPNVRVQAILSIANNNRDDLLPILRKKLKHTSIAEQEALAISLASLNDSSCTEDLKKYLDSSTETVRLAASIALNQLGNRLYEYNIYESAAYGNLFAVIALGKIEGSENILAKITKSSNTQMMINASIALLHKKDNRCFIGIKKLLIDGENKLSVMPHTSLGKTLYYFQIMPFSKKRKDIDQNISLDIKHNILKQALDLDEAYFLDLANDIFRNKQNDLIPYLCQLITKLNSENAIALLKKYADKAGAPLIRDYCNLSLYRMNVEGPYFNYIKRWIKRNNTQELIHLKPFSPDKVKYDKSQYALSPDESTYLLVEIFTAVAEKHNVEGIMLLLDSLKTANRLNRYPLAGILLRATE